MTAEARQWRNTLRWFTNGDFFQTLSQQWALSLKDISCYLIPGFTPSAARLVHNNIISKEVCRVFVLRCHSASHLTCCVSFHRVHLSYAIIQSYNHLQFIQSNKSHSFIQLYIHTWILSHINAYTTYTQYQFIQGCIGHPKSCCDRIPSVRSLAIIVSSHKCLKNKHLAFTFLSSKMPPPVCLVQRCHSL